MEGTREAPSAPTCIVWVTVIPVPISLPVAASIVVLSMSVGGMSIPFQAVAPVTDIFVPAMESDPVMKEVLLESDEIVNVVPLRSNVDPVDIFAPVNVTDPV